MSAAPYTVTPLHVTAPALARAKRYSTLDGAWADIAPGMAVRDRNGVVVAGSADVLSWLTPSTLIAPGI